MRAGSFMEEVKLELDLQDGWNLNRWRNYSHLGVGCIARADALV